MYKTAVFNLVNGDITH